MSLPELEWQFIYGRLAWAVVAATVMAALLPAAMRRSGWWIGALLLASAGLAFLPGQLSPAYWLVLAFQWPSALLAGCCVLRLMAWSGRAPAGACMPAWLALPLAGAGALLYLDTIGWLSLGMYYAGFGPVGAPLAALAGAAACVACIVRGQARPHAMAVLAAIALFSILRLPTGNLWDALIDPLLWGWAVVSLGRSAWRALLLALQRGRPAAPEAAPAIVPAPNILKN